MITLPSAFFGRREKVQGTVNDYLPNIGRASYTYSFDLLVLGKAALIANLCVEAEAPDLRCTDEEAEKLLRPGGDIAVGASIFLEIKRRGLFGSGHYANTVYLNPSTPLSKN